MALRRGRFKGRECRYLYRLSSQSRAYCYQMPSAAHSIAALVGNRRKAHTLKKNHAVYSQGDPADSVFLLQDGRVRLSVLSTRGKEAIIAVLESGSFFGEECLAGQPFRMARATAMTVGTVLEIKKKTMVSVVRGKREFAAAFMAHLLSRNIREAPGPDFAAARELWERGPAGNGDSYNQPGDARRNDRHDPLEGQRVYEQVSQAGLHRVQQPPERPLERSFILAERYFARLTVADLGRRIDPTQRVRSAERLHRRDSGPARIPIDGHEHKRSGKQRDGCIRLGQPSACAYGREPA
jgi:CRP-like cAMP-binding protein